MNNPEAPTRLSKIPLDVGLRVIRPFVDAIAFQIYAEIAKAVQIEAQIRKGYQC